MTNRNIPINKGNYTMETLEKEELFEKYRGEGWEEEYKKYRKNWSEWPLNFHVEEYPLLVDLELSMVCNLKCPMCFTITEKFKKIAKEKNILETGKILPLHFYMVHMQKVMLPDYLMLILQFIFILRKDIL